MHVNVTWRTAALAPLPMAAGALAWWMIPGVADALRRGLAILAPGDVTAAVAALRDHLPGFGLWAPAVSALLMVVQSVAAPIPAFLLTFANGLLCFGPARGFGRPVVETLAGGSRALDLADAFFGRYGSALILVARLLSFVSFDILSHGAGLTPVRFWRFLWAAGLGQLPATVLYSWLGQSATGSVQALFWLVSISFAVAILGWNLAPRLTRRRTAEGAP